MEVRIRMKNPTINRTKRAAITRFMAAILFASALLVNGTPAPAEGWTTFPGAGGGYADKSINYCFMPGFYGVGGKSVVRNALNYWWFYGLSFHEVASDSGTCSIRFRVADFSANGWPAVAGRTSLTTLWGAIIFSDVYFNSDKTNDFHFGNVAQNCVVVCSDNPLDFFTIAEHEIGHALGLGDNYAGEPLCVAGYWVSNGVDNACTNDYYSTDPMYNNAGDGYRRYTQLGDDSHNGIAYIYGTS